MKIIEKVQIKNFRSFFGTKQNDKAEILNISDLNIFSGSNDSGKSNVLRALNLFFNSEIDNAHAFNFETDFNVFKNELTQKQDLSLEGSKSNNSEPENFENFKSTEDLEYDEERK